MFVVNPDNLLDPAIRRGLLIDLEYALDLDMYEATAKKAWELLQLYDTKDLDFVHLKDYKRIRGKQTVSKQYFWRDLRGQIC